MKKKISIAIDGPSAAGKSTIAKMVAKKENFIYIDTGAMYRSVAFYCIKNHIDLNDEQAVEQSISNIQIRLTADNKVYLNDEDVSLQIRTDEVSLGASCVSKYQAVRTFLVDEQRKMAETGNVILDGRDIGTVVLPHADLKIYQIASVETRAKRRYLENKESKEKIETSLKRVKNANLNALLPETLNINLKEGLLLMNNKINGFTSNATLLGVESRSSAPIRFYRDENMESNIKGIYPIGEGAGYAGGIMSSAIDGLKCSEVLLKGER